MVAEVKEAEPGTIKVVVPAAPVSEGKTVPVNVQIGAESAKPADLVIGRLPLVTGADAEPGRSRARRWSSRDGDSRPPLEATS